MQIGHQLCGVQLDGLALGLLHVLVVGDDGQHLVAVLEQHRIDKSRINVELGGHCHCTGQTRANDLVNLGRFKPGTKWRQVFDCEGEVLNDFDAEVDAVKLEFFAQFAGAEHHVVFLLVRVLERGHTLGFFPERDVTAHFVLSKVG